MNIRLSSANPYYRSAQNKPAEIGDVPPSVAQNPKMVYDFKHRTPLPPDPAKTTVQSLKELFGADGVVDLPDDVQYYRHHTILDYMSSNDAAVRTAAQICHLFWNGWDGTEPLSGIISADPGTHNYPDRLYKDNVNGTADGPNYQFWFDYHKNLIGQPGFWRNRPGEEVNKINWLNHVDRNGEVIRRTLWFDKNWRAYDEDTLKTNHKIEIPQNIMQMFSENVPWTQRDGAGRISRISHSDLLSLVFMRDHLAFSLYSDDGRNPTFEGYFRYMSGLIKDTISPNFANGTPREWRGFFTYDNDGNASLAVQPGDTEAFTNDRL